MTKFACGIDEVGRGALAGPIVVASVVFKSYRCIPKKIKDSKQTTFNFRESIFKSILDNAYVGTGIISAYTIDKVGIIKATSLAIKESLKNNICKNHITLIDGKFDINLKNETHYIVKGDCNYVSIAAASIIAKVCRDRIMLEKSLDFPLYNWEKNKGYGTKDHLLAIKLYGITNFHRKSFKIKFRDENFYAR